jgi:hypothetical protein
VGWWLAARPRAAYPNGCWADARGVTTLLMRGEAPDWRYDAWVSTYTAIKAGEVAAVTDDVRRVTGHPPQSLRELLARDHA